MYLRLDLSKDSVHVLSEATKYLSDASRNTVCFRGPPRSIIEAQQVGVV